MKNNDGEGRGQSSVENGRVLRKGEGKKTIGRTTKGLKCWEKQRLNGIKPRGKHQATLCQLRGIFGGDVIKKKKLVSGKRG